MLFTTPLKPIAAETINLTVSHMERPVQYAEKSGFFCSHGRCEVMTQCLGGGQCYSALTAIHWFGGCGVMCGGVKWWCWTQVMILCPRQL